MTISVVETPPVSVTVTEVGPVNIDVVETAVQQVEVETIYNPTSEGMWIETGLGPNGQDWTIWFEDGN